MQHISKNLKTCEFGHQFYKSSECLSCPICAELQKPASGFLSLISAPARRALAGKEIDSLKKLTQFQKSEIAALHGMGPSGIRILENELKKQNLTFKEKDGKK